MNARAKRRRSRGLERKLRPSSVAGRKFLVAAPGPLLEGLILGSAVMVATIASLGAAGFLWAPLDFWANLAWLWLVFGAGLLAASLCLRPGLRWPALLVFAITACSVGVGILPELGRKPYSAIASAGPGLRLIQFNVWGRNIATSRTADWILSQNADVIVLQEGFGQSWRLNKRLRKAYPHWSSCDLPKPCEVMIFSRMPIMQKGSGHLPRSAWAQIDWNGQPITVVGVHYPWPAPVGPERAGLPDILPATVATDRSRLIIAGDFNSAPWSYGLRQLDIHYAIPRRTQGLMSWPARVSVLGRAVPAVPFLPIDQIYAGRGWQTVSMQRGPRLGSDHYPIVVDLAPALGANRLPLGAGTPAP